MADRHKARHYTLTIPITITDNTDLEHFQPDTVVAETPFGQTWVSGSDREALAAFFAFCLAHTAPDGMSIDEYSRSDLARERRAIIQRIVKLALSESTE